MEITATEYKNNLGKYMDMAADGEEIIVTKNGHEYIKVTKAKRDPIEILNGLVGIVSEDDYPPLGEDPRFDHIAGRDRDDSNNERDDYDSDEE